VVMLGFQYPRERSGRGKARMLDMPATCVCHSSKPRPCGPAEWRIDAACCSVLQRNWRLREFCCSVLQRVAACFSLKVFGAESHLLL